MLGLGRALGETMAVTIILSVSGAVTFNLISQANPSTIAANIALDFPESSGLDDQRPDRLRPRPLRDHPGRQHGRARDHRPPERPVGMADERTERSDPDGAAAPRAAAAAAPLPGWATYGGGRRLAAIVVAASCSRPAIFTVALARGRRR